ncbi:A24 family peptidase [Bradyrhizobium sp.]|uniref:prepilin peptidase n=1 Tax=Bradyrhizobium sp. TaxID=376 RepID=UPI001D53DE04|nr:A24 family peptidase [Bradyrhizobium sp.]MBI5321174.1 prepilin peptidase [Bradyrhizobium sp.]
MGLESELPGWLVPVLMSPLAGSFVGVLIRRLPEGRSIVWARSQCESCRRDLSPLELVPIASYAAQRGRCNTCGTPIPPFHIAIELASILVAGWAAIVDPDPIRIWMSCLLGWGLLALAWIDARHMRLPDAITLSLLVIGLSAQALLTPERLPAGVLGAVAGYAGFRGIALMYRAIRKRDGLGAGDAKLLAASGAWLGWTALPDVIFLAALLAILFVVVRRLDDRTIDSFTAVPFGPFLCTASWIIHLYGPLLFVLA